MSRAHHNPLSIHFFSPSCFGSARRQPDPQGIPNNPALYVITILCVCVAYTTVWVWVRYCCWVALDDSKMIEAVSKAFLTPTPRLQWFASFICGHLHAVECQPSYWSHTHCVAVCSTHDWKNPASSITIDNSNTVSIECNFISNCCYNVLASALQVHPPSSSYQYNVRFLDVRAGYHLSAWRHATNDWRCSEGR